MVNLGSIDLHPWLSRRGSLDSPDWAILDLDPHGSPFPHVVRIARAIGKVLRGIGLTPYLKTSGATGIHVYVPLQAGYTYDHAVHFCEGIARLVAQDLPDIATVERVVSRRGRQGLHRLSPEPPRTDHRASLRGKAGTGCLGIDTARLGRAGLRASSVDVYDRERAPPYRSARGSLPGNSHGQTGSAARHRSAAEELHREEVDPPRSAPASYSLETSSAS